MPLPPALAAKLAKRGLYQTPVQRPEKDRSTKRDYRGVTGCPNKSNIHHDCTQWCEMHWKGLNVPPAYYVRNVGKMVQKYPLPRNWTEVFDKGVKRYYYWDMENDLVSWLPPKHPRAVLTESAAKLRERRIKGESSVEERVVYKVDENKSEKRRSSKSSKRDRDKSDGSEKRHKYDEKSHRKRPHREDVIDPMDPASYSDIPIGTWSDGLESNKAGVDSTASGALYQQRPYPAPGEVLSTNKAIKSKKASNNASHSP